MTTQQRLVLVVCILASFVAFLDGSVVNVALPAIARDVHGGLATQQWVVDAYTITLGSLMLIAGAFSDIFGRKKVMKLGLAGFAITSLLCTVAPNGGFLILARALQGIAGAFLVPSSLAFLMSTFSGRDQGKAVGAWTAWTGIAFIIGPLLGGLFVDLWSWRLIFAINIVPIALTLRLLSFVHADERRRYAHIDALGAVLAGIGLGGPVFALIEQPSFGWASPLIFGMLIGGMISTFFFIRHERHALFPMVSLKLFSVRNFAVGNIATAFIYGALSLATFLITIFLQQIADYSAIGAGLALLPITLIMFALSPKAGELSAKLGPRWFMTAGPMLVAVGLLLMLHTGSAAAYWSTIFPGVLVFGLGFSATVAPLTATVLGSITSEHAGIASAINNAVSRIAGLLLIACVGVVVGNHLTLAGFHRTMIVAALLMAFGGLVSAFGLVDTGPQKLD